MSGINVSEHRQQPNQIDELLELYVLDLLDEDETALVEEQMRRDPEIRERVRELRGAAALLTYDLEPMEPPAELKDRIMQTVREESRKTAPDDDSQAVSSIQQHPGWSARARTLVPWAAAAMFALALILSLLWNFQLRQELDDRPEVARFPVEIVGGQDSLSGEVVVLESGDAAILSLAELDRPEQGFVYQAWLIADGSPASAGTFVPDETGFANVLIRGDLDQVQIVAVTVEPEGGSPQPTSDPFIVSEIG